MIPVNRYFFSAPIFPTPEERKAFWEKVYKEAEHYRECMMAPQSVCVEETDRGTARVVTSFALNHPLSEDLLRDAEAMQQDIRIIEGKSGPFLAVSASPVAEMTRKEEEDADMALVETWDARRRAQIYLLLFDGYGMRESKAREILRKVK